MAMRNPMRILTGLATLLLLAGGASATNDLHATETLATDHAAVAGEAGAYPDDRYADADAAVVTENASALADGDASTSDVEDAKSGSFFGWFSLRLSAVVDKVRVLCGVDLPETADAGADVYASDDGLDLDADALGHTLDGTAAGDVDGMTWDAMAKVHGVKGSLPATPDVGL